MNTTNFSQSNDQLAKLMAHENINIVRGNVKTASFDIKNRVLVLPQWKDMSKDAEQMLIGHEVGHALFTSMEKYGKVFEKENSHLRGYANVIEDARIEARMKERYPGLRKTFIDGYKYLSSKDFFGLKGRDMNSLLLIDRINLYFKLGYNSGVVFTPDESAFVQRVEKCNNETEVLELASEIYEYSKSQREKMLADIDDILAESRGESEDDEFDEFDYDQDDVVGSSDEMISKQREENARASKNYGDFKDGVDPELAPETLDNLESKLSEYADSSIKFNYFVPEFENTYLGDKVVIGYSRVLSELKGKVHAHESISRREVDEFKMSTSGIVNYLIKEFEMKKSASAYKRAKISKLGQINVNKLYAYKVKEDLFKQVMTVKDGKKHGMVFLLDWSGSMSNNIAETVEQVINLAMFCQKTQIAYRVFAFTDGYEDDSYQYNGSSREFNKDGLGEDSCFRLLELFSDRMTNSEFNSMTTLMLNRPWRFRNYGLNGTPLEEAMIYMVKFLDKFKSENKVEKLSLITLTDGEGGRLYNTSNSSWDGNAYDDNSKLVKAKAILRDPITKNEYPLGSSATTQMAAIRKLIADRYDASVVGFYIISKNLREIERFYKNNTEYTNTSQVVQQAAKTQERIKNDKYELIKLDGYHEFYLMSSLKIVDHDLEKVHGDMSAAAISKNLSKMMNSRKISRVVLDKFINIVA